MKKLLLLFTLLLSTLSYAQQEAKLDLADALIFRSLGLSYENYINNESSLGLSLLVNFAKRTEDLRFNEDLMITPYFRHYFSNNHKWNLFGEAFIGINSGKYIDANSSGSNIIYEKYTDTALGVVVGTKYISREGFVLDIFAGLGRNFFGTDSPNLVPRIGLNVGWRF
ncbi:hypothetical protein [Polaribacter sp.]|uniref:hypothetical protein n=1 Tax=Polaribacter sp. TaxID=1920175 RepID=UPI003EF14D01